MLDFLKRRRRARLRESPCPDEWRRIIEDNVAMFGRLSAADQEELLGHAQVLIAEKHFEGCGGLELTDEMRVTIAAQASVLLLHRNADYFPQLTSILVYPSTYLVPTERSLGAYVLQEHEEARLGHTGMNLGVVVLAWDDALRGARIADDGENLVLHEFAHQLDLDDHAADGTPPLDGQLYRSWSRVLTPEFDALRRARASGTPTLIDQYGATNPAEFFAVVTELFFERPGALRDAHAALYDVLRSYYVQDPAAWPGDGSRSRT